MKVLCVFEYYHPHIGGAEHLFKNLAERLCAKGHTVTVVTRRLENTGKKENLHGVRIVRVNTLNRHLFACLSLYAVIQAGRKHDVVLTSTYAAAFPAWIAARLLGRPCIINVLEVWVSLWKKLGDVGTVASWAYELLERLLYRLGFDCYVAISKFTSTELIAAGVSATKVRTIYGGFDESAYGPDKYDGQTIREQLSMQDRLVCFSWGRPGVSKGHAYAVRAMALLKKKIPRAVLVLMLSDLDTYKKQHRRLRRLIEQLDLRDQVIVVAPAGAEMLRHYIKAADCVIVPSLSEGFGYTVLEACHMGKAVVASDCASIPEVVGGRYVLVNPGDPAAIAEGVMRVFRGECEAGELKSFRWEETVAQYEKCLRDVLRQRPVRRTAASEAEDREAS